MTTAAMNPQFRAATPASSPVRRPDPATPFSVPVGQPKPPRWVQRARRTVWGVLLVLASIVCVALGYGTGPERPPLFGQRTAQGDGQAG